MIQKISSDDYSNENFKFGTGKNIKITNIKIWAQRISYVGELGFELYVDKEYALKLYEILIKEGKNFDLSHCGMHAMDIMRMESGFIHWGHDISPEENQYQAGLNFTISYKKNVNFIGKDALLKIKDKPLDKIMTMFTLKDSKPGEPLLLHEEPIYLDDKIIGRTTSGNYSFCFDKNLSFGYLNSGNTIETLRDKKLFIEVEKIKYPVKILSKPLNTRDFKNI
jgi:4-methylaminobutanoate oxidase (formaldehyde-forming)